MENDPQTRDDVLGGRPAQQAVPPTGNRPPTGKKGVPKVVWFILGGGALGCLLLVVLGVTAAVIIPRILEPDEEDTRFEEEPPFDEDAVDSFVAPAEPDAGGEADVDRQYRAQIETQLDASGAVYTAEGYAGTHDPHIDRLTPNATDSINFELEADVEYVVIGVCDSDCSDLDLRLKDENGNTIDEDFATDDVPIVEVSPAWTGRFDLDVVMANCSESYCYYGVAIFGKR